MTRDLDQAGRILDEEEQARVLNRADAQMARDVPVIPLYQVPAARRSQAERPELRPASSQPAHERGGFGGSRNSPIVVAARGRSVPPARLELALLDASLSSCDRPSFEGYNSRMAATGHMLSPAEPEIVSPELVLVDPRLATDARGLLSDPDDTVERLEQQSSLDSAEPPLLVERSVDPGSSADEEVAAARRRLTERSELEPPKRRSLRLLVVSRLRRRRAPSPSS